MNPDNVTNKDGWSPRYEDLNKLAYHWGIDLDEANDAIISQLDVYERIIDDLKAFRAAAVPESSGKEMF